jgi:hypothetical protein
MAILPKSFLKVVCLSLFLSCYSATSSNRYTDLQLLQGTWYGEEKDLYHTIYFQDSTHIVLDSHIDTLFNYEYKLVGSSLYLYKAHGELLNSNRILKLTSDSLIFENLIDKEGIQRYARRQ